MPSGLRCPHQSRFHARWAHLRDPHVRTLAWLLDAPGLLDPAAPAWTGRIAQLGPASAATARWLSALDRNPASLHAALAIQPLTRLGRYAENLLAFYLRARQRLIAQNIQVRGAKNETVGEFDFLLRHAGGTLIHWEFATKLYLLEQGGNSDVADDFVGPGLADTLGAKIRKIMDQQLALSRQPKASDVLPGPVAAARALVKGWLFYPGSCVQQQAPAGIFPEHCKGFWCTLRELYAHDAPRYAILPRLAWLAPARLPMEQCLDRTGLMQRLEAQLAADPAPVLVALLEPRGDVLLEFDRGFIVPEDWPGRPRSRLAAADYNSGSS